MEKLRYLNNKQRMQRKQRSQLLWSNFHNQEPSTINVQTKLSWIEVPMITTDGNNAISGGGKSIMVQTEMPLGQVSKTSTGEVN